MKTKISLLGGTLLLLGTLSNANAMGVTLSPSSNVTGVEVGDIVSFDVILDFADDPTIGGGVNIFYDPAAFALVLLTDNAIGNFANNPPGTGTAGLITSWAFANVPGIASASLGSVQLEVLAGIGGGSFIEVAEDGDGGVGGEFVSDNTGAPYLEGSLEFNGLTVTAVPVPAAVWFLLSGLTALFGFGRSRHGQAAART